MDIYLIIISHSRVRHLFKTCITFLHPIFRNELNVPQAERRILLHLLVPITLAVSADAHGNLLQ
jgi:hypothetical protein